MKNKNAPSHPPPKTPRVVANVSERVYRAVRIRCFERGIHVQDYILELLAKDGIR